MNGSGLQVGVALIQAVALLMSVAFVTYTLVIASTTSGTGRPHRATAAHWPGTSSFRPLTKRR